MEDKHNTTGSKASEIRVSNTLSIGELETIKKRKEVVRDALKSFDITCDKDSVPTVAVLGSGGGLRAMIALLGTLEELQRENLLDCITYLCGVSGSTWCMSSVYKEKGWSGSLSELVATIGQRVTEEECDLLKTHNRINESAKEETYSLTNFWAATFVYYMTKQMNTSPLSEQVAVVKDGQNPYPVYAAIDKTVFENEKDDAGTWFEFTPHEAGYPAYGVFVDVRYFGSKFNGGVLEEKQCERDQCYLQGLWGSAFGSMVEIKENMWHWLSSKMGLGVRTMERSDDILIQQTKSFIPGTIEMTQAVVKTWDCVRNWCWGKNYNFLFNYRKDGQAGALPKHLQEEELIHLVDAGLAINSAYPLMLRQERQVDLILSFDYSEGDPFLMECRNGEPVSKPLTCRTRRRTSVTF
ncbi:cytosolic phospholipase A2 gamma-like isoform X2 [Latimeria chalumnae]|uniref:cytosolic phospholipase A2 gamma-like isoform X2 n=1 Tax=Latimeria chalumnae TaxID=7897 RepID=UPI00313CBD3F